MNWSKVRAVVDKELADARKNKMILLSMALIPVLLVALTLGTAYAILRDPESMDEEDMSIIPAELLWVMEPTEALVVMFNDQFLFYFLLIPMAMPVYIAAYSIVGEKEAKSLEPLLAAPVSVWELLVAKSLAAVVPSVILTWLSFVVLVAGGYLILPPVVFDALVATGLAGRHGAFEPVAGLSIGFQRGHRLVAGKRPPRGATDHRHLCGAYHRPQHGGAGGQDLSGSFRHVDGGRGDPAAGCDRALFRRQAVPAREDSDALEVKVGWPAGRPCQRRKQ